MHDVFIMLSFMLAETHSINGGLLILKQLENLSDENVVLQCKRNPYYQFFCSMKNFQLNTPCQNTLA